MISSNESAPRPRCCVVEYMGTGGEKKKHANESIPIEEGLQQLGDARQVVSVRARPFRSQGAAQRRAALVGGPLFPTECY